MSSAAAVAARRQGGLFLSILHAHFAARLDELDRILSTEDDPDQQAREAAAGLMRTFAAQPEWDRLFFEFAVYAARNEGFRTELVARYRALRKRIAELLARRAERLGIEPAVPPQEVAAMSFAMANGIARERMLEPEAVPDRLFPEMLAIFFSGLRARGEAGASPPPAGRASRT